MNKKILPIILVAIFLVGIGIYFLSQKSGNSIVAVKQSEIIELKDGDFYDLNAEFVTKEINGKKFTMLAYNGMIPGPIIKVAQGSEITINFKNNFDMETALHSHGVRMDNEFDGAPPVTQQPIKPGQTFTYKLKFPDAGVYWYHPHVREDYQQELGLYGNYLVVASSENYWPPVNREILLFLDDILIENNQINLNKDGADHTLMGRFGNVMLVNGETDYSLSAKKGEVIRFYITNAANVRPFNFFIEGARMKLVGGDGGAYEQEEWKDSVIIGPSERAIIEVLFENAGSYALQTKTPDKTYSLGQVIVSEEAIDVSYASDFATLRTNDNTVKSIDPFRQYFNKAPDKQLALTVDMMGQMMNMQGMGHGGHMMPDGTMMSGSMMNPSLDGIEWEDENTVMNAMSDTTMIKWKIVDQDTNKENMDIDWDFKAGDKVKIRIFNDPDSMHPMQHPIHFHGQRFLVLAQNGEENTNLVWKDTIMVPSGQTVDILLDVSNPGEWMAHCHIAEHLEADMMFAFQVE
ncbi:multicopper oxidase family protein [Candidatus Woesearchaeota archaeon]|nr:multicopper oxidase family protein [Candidatus Woesearchaeota archaeon]